MVTTKRRSAVARPSGRSVSGSRRPKVSAAKPRSRTTARRPAASRRQAPRRAARPGLLASVGSVFGSHAEDVWGIVLLTAAVLGALALYADALGPVGAGLRHGFGSVLGVGRFVVPLGCAGAGVILVLGPFQREAARVAVGLALTLVAVSGLADIAGGAPRLTATASQLAGAGGWVGIAAGNPLRQGVGDWGASVVLIAVLILALVLFTGVTLRRAVAAIAGAAVDLWHVLLPDHEDVEDDSDVVDGSPVRTAALGAPELFDVALTTPAPLPSEADEPQDHGESDVAPSPVVSPVPAAVAVTDGAAAGHGAPLEVDLGMPAGEWRLPPPKTLSRSKQQTLDHKEIAVAGRALVDSLAAHGVATRLVGNTVGPTVTRFELELGPGVKVARVTSLAKDIAYAMASPDVRILAPIPGKSAIGVEVPNRRRQLVTLGDVLASDEARKATHPLEVALGRDIAGRPVMASLAEMPHILISGATGAGKSSCINSLLTSILMRATPEQVRLILVDPKRVELGQYNGLPHLLTQVVVDPKKAANALAWAVTEMERRYDILAEAGMRDIDGYNEALERDELGATVYVPEDDTGDADDDADDRRAVDSYDSEDASGEVPEGVDIVGEAADIVNEAAARAAQRVEESRAVVDPTPHRERLPYVLVVVDELNDLMMVAARDVEESVCRIAQMARAVGIHLVLATQRPSVDVITGVIKANVPSRLAFSVSSLADSRVILDQPGAERLVGKGDMLLLTASSSVARRIQGPWVAESEVRSVVAHWRRQHQPQYVEGLAGDGGSRGGGGGVDDEDDDLLPAAMELVVRSQLGSTSMLQRKLRVGFSRAGRLMDLLERRGVVGPSEGSKARAVLMTPEEFEQLSDR
ncbi:MAG TPA: DNA translocase FtsK 4TM domain-containing protein [Acidimicrobiales bacterium]|nr:DNA translocase FtsK 4TM domain-containing protein [Acidimicrobiales bacterium]